MNDLNSVFIVGRISSFEMVDNELCIKLSNNSEIYNVLLQGIQAKKIYNHSKKGLRIGVNGRLTTDGGISIIAFSIQFLDKVK